MEPIKNIMVCLDLTDIDAHLIRYAAIAAEAFDSENVCFLHVIQAYNLAKRPGTSFPDPETALKDMVHKELDQQVDDHFRRNFRTDIIVRLEEQDAADGIIACVRETGADLLLLGQKSGETRQARYGGKVSAQAPCDILFVPENRCRPVGRVLCALDFTPASRAAFDRAVHLRERKGATIACYFLHDRSKAYFPASTQRSASRSLRSAQKQYLEFMQSLGLDPEAFPVRIEPADHRTGEADKLYRAAERQEADLIIVGARGDIATQTSLLGNVTESLRRMELAIPVMIVRNRENQKFFFSAFYSA